LGDLSDFKTITAVIKLPANECSPDGKGVGPSTAVGMGDFWIVEGADMGPTTVPPGNLKIVESSRNERKFDLGCRG